MGFIVTSLIMFGFWVSLSGYFDAFHLAAGALSSMAVAFFSGRLLIGEGADLWLGAARVLRFLRYLPWLMLEVAKANLDVAFMALHPKAPIDPRIVTLRADLKEDMGITTLANSITLTPGTVTISASPEGEFLVHAISKDAADSLLDGRMAGRVKAIEGGDV